NPTKTGAGPAARNASSFGGSGSPPRGCSAGTWSTAIGESPGGPERVAAAARGGRGPRMCRDGGGGRGGPRPGGGWAEQRAQQERDRSEHQRPEQPVQPAALVVPADEDRRMLDRRQQGGAVADIAVRDAVTQRRCRRSHLCAAADDEIGIARERDERVD